MPPLESERATHEAVVAGRRRAELLRQRPPRRAPALDPEDAFRRLSRAIEKQLAADVGICD